MDIGHHCQEWKLPILGVATVVLCDVILTSFFLVYVEPKLFFCFRAGKFSSAAPILELSHCGIVTTSERHWAGGTFLKQEKTVPSAHAQQVYSEMDM